MNAKNVIPAAPQPLADEDLGTIAGGCGHKHKRHTTGYRRTTGHRRTSRWSRKSHGSKKSKF